MSLIDNKKASLKQRIQTYLIRSYYDGYELQYYFTEQQQIMMFEKLLSCDENFSQEWEKGVYCKPMNKNETLYLSPYIKKQSSTKKIYRKVCSHINNNKLTNGAKNLLKSYMIEYAQNYTISENYRMEQIFCGIFHQENKRKDQYISQVSERAREPRLEDEIRSYLGTNGGKKTRKRRFKTRKNRVK